MCLQATLQPLDELFMSLFRHPVLLRSHLWRCPTALEGALLAVPYKRVMTRRNEVATSVVEVDHEGRLRMRGRPDNQVPTKFKTVNHNDA
jgi:hypothetical protein